MGIGLVSCIWGMYLTCVRLGTHTLFLLSSCGRWRAPLVGELHLRRFGALRKVRYLPLLLVTSCGRWWVPWVGELHMRLMVSCVRLGISPCFCLHPVVGDEYHVLVICIWGRYGALRKVRYLALLLVTSCVGDEYNRSVNCIWGLWCPA